MNKLLAILFLLSFGCAQRSPGKPDKVEYRMYELTDKDEPKHFYVYLKDVETGQVYSHVYVSKHCNSHRETAVIGKIYKLKRVTYTQGGTTTSQFEGLSCIFCESCY